MKGFHFLSAAALMIALASCSKEYNPQSHLSVQEQDRVLTEVIRYLAKPPDGLSYQKRFHKAYDQYYEQKSLHRFDAYFEDQDTHYFLISRQAPSLTEKRVATGGRLKLDDNGKLTEYEEVFRTWKMVPDTLTRKSILLFDKMVNGESLEPYLTRNSVPEEYIEFPDDHSYFDKTERMWKTK